MLPFTGMFSRHERHDCKQRTPRVPTLRTLRNRCELCVKIIYEDVICRRNDKGTNSMKLGSYLSIKYNPFQAISFDLSAYHQAAFNNIFHKPRLAISSGATWNISEHFGLSAIYQFIYDYSPLVPIRKDFHKIIFGFEISF